MLLVDVEFGWYVWCVVFMCWGCEWFEMCVVDFVFLYEVDVCELWGDWFDCVDYVFEYCEVWCD